MADLREMPEAELRGRVQKLLAEAHPERTDSITFRRKHYELDDLVPSGGSRGPGHQPQAAADGAGRISTHSRSCITIRR
jgi:hypothetical protein